MKTANYLIIFISFLVVLGCKKERVDSREEIVEKESLQPMANESDIKFAEALKFIHNEQNSQAAKSIREGIASLNIEGKNLNVKTSEKLKNLTSRLDMMAGELENGSKVEINKVRMLMANAEIAINHSYLEVDNVFNLEAPQFIEIDSTRRDFNAAFSKLKNVEGDIKADAKKDRDALLNEGRKLDEEYKAWNKRTFDFNRKAEAHFNREYPEFSY